MAAFASLLPAALASLALAGPAEAERQDDRRSRDGLVDPALASLLAEPLPEAAGVRIEQLPNGVTILVEPQVASGAPGVGSESGAAGEPGDDDAWIVLRLDAGTIAEPADALGASRLAAELVTLGRNTETDAAAEKRGTRDLAAALDARGLSVERVLSHEVGYGKTLFVARLPRDAVELAPSVLEHFAAAMQPPFDLTTDDASVTLALERLRAAEAGETNVSVRLTDLMLPMTLGEHALAARFPKRSGLFDAADGADGRLADAARRYAVERWRPEGAVVSIVNMPPSAADDALAAARGAFRQVAAREAEAAPPKPRPNTPQQRPTHELAVAADGAIPVDVVQLLRFEPGDGPLSTHADLLEALARRAAADILERRLAAAAERAGAGLIDASAFTISDASEWSLHSSIMTGASGRWAETVDALVRETRLATSTPPTRDEVGFAQRRLLDRERPTVFQPGAPDASESAGARARRFADAAATGGALASSRQLRDAAHRLAPLLDAERIRRAGRVLAPESSMLFVISAEASRDEAAPARAREIVAAALAEPLPPRGEAVAVKPLLDRPPQPVEPAVLRFASSDSYLTLRFPNRVEAFVRPFATQDDGPRVVVAAAFLGPQLLETAETWPAAHTLWSFTRFPTIEGMTPAEFRAALDRRGVALDVSMDENWLVFRAEAQLDGLDGALAAVHALARSGRVDDASLASIMESHAAIDAATATRPEFAPEKALLRAAEAVGDVRTRAPDAADFVRVDRDDAQRALRRSLDGPVSIAVVGEVDAREAARAISVYVGSLPAREHAPSAELMTALALDADRPDELRRVEPSPLAGETGVIIRGYVAPETDPHTANGRGPTANANVPSDAVAAEDGSGVAQQSAAARRAALEVAMRLLDERVERALSGGVARHRVRIRYERHPGPLTLPIAAVEVAGPTDRVAESARAVDAAFRALAERPPSHAEFDRARWTALERLERVQRSAEAAAVALALGRFEPRRHSDRWPELADELRRLEPAGVTAAIRDLISRGRPVEITLGADAD